jgi:hypothetical protein
MRDIVLDTCTLVHANNSKSGYQEDSIDERINNSYIGLEYIKHLTPGSLGYSLIQFAAINQRFEFVSNKVPNRIKNYIEQLIRNKKDRIFLRVTVNSIEKVLVSHDFTDYQKLKRKRIKRDIDVNIVEAKDLNGAI